ncbi:hypothetical protein CWC38_07730 [Kocuria tytonicola]|uniref:hypothetical protein n=1 Tax=Kocuria tytonicola TaxID=2055946 RepID=UPI000EF8D0C2|nr:hypothetical protein [Kocuria tytonicola]RLZ03054.1 hypothetical protein CWC38_07730 [Kocuria tytonicola]
MTPRTQTTGRAPAGAYALMLAMALVGAAAVGGVASLARPENPWLAFAVFAGCTLAPMAMLGWFVFVSRYTVQEEPHAEDGVEHRWYEQATSGAFHDIITLGGIALLVLSVSQLEVSGSTVLLWVLILAVADVAVRDQVLKRRAVQ